jgi:hypothetical protein
MSSPILPIVHTITQDRIRDAETARLARQVAAEPPPQRPRRIRRLAGLAFTAIR